MLRYSLLIMFVINIVFSLISAASKPSRKYYSELYNLQLKHGIKPDNWSTWIRCLEFFWIVFADSTKVIMWLAWVWVSTIKISRVGSKIWCAPSSKHELFRMIMMVGLICSFSGILRPGCFSYSDHVLSSGPSSWVSMLFTGSVSSCCCPFFDGLLSLSCLFFFYCQI